MSSTSSHYHSIRSGKELYTHFFMITANCLIMIVCILQQYSLFCVDHSSYSVKVFGRKMVPYPMFFLMHLLKSSLTRNMSGRTSKICLLRAMMKYIEVYRFLTKEKNPGGRIFTSYGWTYCFNILQNREPRPNLRMEDKLITLLNAMAKLWSCSSSNSELTSTNTEIRPSAI